MSNVKTKGDLYFDVVVLQICNNLLQILIEVYDIYLKFTEYTLPSFL